LKVLSKYRRRRGKNITALWALDGNKVVLEAESTNGTSFYLPVKTPKLWSPDDPTFLYDNNPKLEDARGKVTDSIKAISECGIKLGKVNGVTKGL